MLNERLLKLLPVLADEILTGGHTMLDPRSGCHVERALTLTDNLRVYLKTADKMTEKCWRCEEPQVATTIRYGLAVGELEAIIVRLRMALGLPLEELPQ